jgi:glutathione S-transferase
MIEFNAGTGPDTQAIGIALEEMFLNYTIMPGRAPVPVITIGGPRLVDMGNILLALARKTNRFLPDATEAAPWLSKSPPGEDLMAERLEAHDYVLGFYSIADMAMYPRLAGRTDVAPAIARWQARLRLRPAVGRGMVVVAK